MSSPSHPRTILFVFAWLVVGGEETEVRLLARNLDRSRYKIDVVACFRKDDMPLQTHDQLRALGVDVDTAPYDLSFDETVLYLAEKLPLYDVVVSCQNVADIYPALERLHFRPPLIEHGGLVSEALAGPKHFTTRYVGVCRSIRDAAASRMPGREAHAVEIPSMVDLKEFDPGRRMDMRVKLGISECEVLIGWVGRLDAKKNIEHFIEAAALVHAEEPGARFVIVGGPDAFMPCYAEQLKALSVTRGLSEVLTFLGDRSDVPDLLAACDIFVWLSRGEGMPHVIAEAGAASLPVIATADNGAMQQIEHGVSGLFVPYDDPQAVAENMQMLIQSPDFRTRLGKALRQGVEDFCSVEVVIPQWEKMFDTVWSERQPSGSTGLFRSFLQAGFECSSHRLRGIDGIPGRRLDIIAATDHDRFAEDDYRHLSQLGIRTVRDGLRWHRIEGTPGTYDWSSALPMIRAARNTNTQVIWDLLHYGWPDHLDIWSPQFIKCFSRYAAAAAKLVRDESDGPPFYCPVNEISFFSWAGGDAGYLNPFARGRGFELKVQLSRASIEAMEAVLSVDSRARFVHCDPAINIIADPSRPSERATAEGQRRAQYQSWDMLSGRTWPQLGGAEKYLDIMGVNYYHNNQWIHGGLPIDVDHPLYKPFRKILVEIYARYGKPLLVAETGIEGDRREGWLAYVGEEAGAAMQAGVQLEGICLYPIVNHPGWDDDRPCENGLFAFKTQDGRRDVYRPLATELQRQAKATELYVSTRRPMSVSI
jgi:polysaccharide biosynthesis protein PelF